MTKRNNLTRRKNVNEYDYNSSSPRLSGTLGTKGIMQVGETHVSPALDLAYVTHRSSLTRLS